MFVVCLLAPTGQGDTASCPTGVRNCCLLASRRSVAVASSSWCAGVVTLTFSRPEPCLCCHAGKIRKQNTPTSCSNTTYKLPIMPAPGSSPSDFFLQLQLPSFPPLFFLLSPLPLSPPFSYIFLILILPSLPSTLATQHINLRLGEAPVTLSSTTVPFLSPLYSCYCPHFPSPPLFYFVPVPVPVSGSGSVSSTRVVIGPGALRAELSFPYI